ncbi:MAG: division/cell wall cluster transcriptional repressor MraZ [Chitinivibrionales bacterium]|nr:division/cell wall cluster transcriptional repressor MraZ [Chitinivibrionales bacterium]
MSRFRGSYQYSIDAKGRINVPAKFRKALNPEADETFVIVRGPDKCLQAYPLDTWQSVEEKLDARPQTPDTTRLRRELYSSIADSKLDAQGRIAITPKQMSIAHISSKVVLEGQGAYIEIWSPEIYDTYFSDDSNFEDVYYQSVQDGIKAS